jgi:hypothetical protein
MLATIYELRRRLFRPTAPDVFVLGNQKSGTTVIAAALAECAGVSASLDLPGIHSRQMTNAYVDRSLTLDRIARRCRWCFSARILKEPILTFYIHELLDAFPQAQFIYVVRDPRDNIRSVLNRLDLRGDRTKLAVTERNGLSAAWREVIQNRRLGFSFENYVESLASRWLYLWQRRISAGDRLITFRYEDFVADKIGSVCSLARRIGLGIHTTELTSVDRQFQPRGNRSVDWSGFFGNNLTIINEICQPAMQDLAYELHRCRAMRDGVTAA